MNRPLRFALILAVGLCAIDGIGVRPDRQAGAQSRGPFSPLHEPPPRMSVGMVKDDAVVAWTLGKATNPHTNEESDILNWYQADLRSGAVSPLEWPPLGTLRRWYWEEGRLWFGFEAMYGSFGPNVAELLRTKPLGEGDGPALSPDEQHAVEPHPDQKVKTETCMPGNEPFRTGETIERLSGLKPLMGAVNPIRTDWYHDRDLGLFDHRIGGFDFIPRTLDHWTLVMSVRYTMQIWDCRSTRIATEKGEEIRNTWTLVTEFWVPWMGQFFAFERNRYEYLLVRDCGEVHELRLDYLDREAWAREPGPDERKRWHGRQLLDPIDYLIALIYIEPENTVYGFGPNFYVRLATGDGTSARRSTRLEKVPCRDVTKGKAIRTDDDGETHELGEPFRTIWQCANVLKEDGVLDDLDDENGEGASKEE